MDVCSWDFVVDGHRFVGTAEDFIEGHYWLSCQLAEVTAIHWIAAAYVATRMIARTIDCN